MILALSRQIYLLRWSASAWVRTVICIYNVICWLALVTVVVVVHHAAAFGTPIMFVHMRRNTNPEATGKMVRILLPCYKVTVCTLRVGSYGVSTQSAQI